VTANGRHAEDDEDKSGFSAIMAKIFSGTF
jgi:hypothetical protein